MPAQKEQLQDSDFECADCMQWFPEEEWNDFMNRDLCNECAEKAQLLLESTIDETEDDE